MAQAPHPATEPASYQRHYPLDLPSGLPFERYEHRRLTARDILVHRIVSKLLSPTPAFASALDAHRPTSNPSRSSSSHSYHNFGPLRPVDKTLARDVELLRKMLITSSTEEWVSQTLVKPFTSFVVNIWVNRPPEELLLPRHRTDFQESTIEEEILDLIRRHYMETDDATTRLWLQTLQPSRPSSYTTLPGKTAKKGSFKRLVQERKQTEEQKAAEDYKRWYDNDTALLKALQEQTLTSNQRGLYEGGAFLYALRKPLSKSRAIRQNFHKTTEWREKSFFAVEGASQTIRDEVYPWPEHHAPRRVLHMPSFYGWRQKHEYFQTEQMPVDFASGRTGRGRDRDGIWSTSRWSGDDLPRGRMMRRGRRRATSEPPPGLFTAARLPFSFNATRELLIFPKMSLATIERRARRRSLSRTRVAEMFNWDVVLTKPPARPQIKATFELHLKIPSQHMHVKRQAFHRKRVCDLFSARHIGDYAYPLCDSDLDKCFLNINRWLDTPAAHDYIAAWLWEWGPEFVITVRFIGDRHTTMEIEGRGHYKPDTCWGARPVYSVLPAELSSPLSAQLLQSSKPSWPAPCANCTSSTHVTARCTLPCGYCGAPNPDLKRTTSRTSVPSCAPAAAATRTPRAISSTKTRWVAKVVVVCAVSKATVDINGRGRSTFITVKTVAEVKNEDVPEHNVDNNPQDDETASSTPRTARRNKRKHRPPPGSVKKEEAKPWYSPLEPRMRPVVMSKTGKNTAKWAGADAVAAVRIGGCR
ncbi:hypothetical protein M406DRAFT_70210 [Cryphonectria parasitica EP155]|uniref:Uncharacterized protein n=1 Tax=Cryphonectria parasitica (strain ATCC 38755 / EP155) TaxID=660469 RepID=A0A9P4Y701_CRYP1|nr:uncharacterized protein M406DRAFT_70210 [Cryphonectria parasitica EP155]KAF3768114.1 hypothetical protein M406DRAFT_70210 [Cryphonectria parasitica EP155]